jgi:hypothetical protein
MLISKQYATGSKGVTWYLPFRKNMQYISYGEERMNEVDLLLPKKAKKPVICIVVAHKAVKVVDPYASVWYCFLHILLLFLF